MQGSADRFILDLSLVPGPRCDQARFRLTRRPALDRGWNLEPCPKNAKLGDRAIALNTRTSSPLATAPLWALLFGLIALRGLDLGLATSTVSPASAGLGFWLATLGIIAALWALSKQLNQHLSPRWKSRLLLLLGPVFVFALPSLLGLSGYDQQKHAILEALSLGLTLLATWICASSSGPRWTQGFTKISFALCAGFALVEQAIGHPLLPIAARAALQGALLLVVLIKALSSMASSASIELRVSAALLGAPLVARVFALGSWTALLGVPVPEAYCNYTLAIWGLCALGLCATTFPRGKGPSIFTFSLSAALSVALVFLIYLHYLKRFGTIQAQFNAISLPVLGVHFPYPEWQSTAASSVFAVSIIFAGLLVLRCLGQASSRNQGLALALWFCAGIGINRGLDLMCLALALDQLRAAFPKVKPAKLP